MLDPTGSVFHLKDVVFVLLVAYNIVFFKPDLRYLPHILLVFSALAVGYIAGEMQVNHVDYEVFFGMVKGFSPLILLLWISRYNVIKLSIVPAIVTCILIDVLFILVTLYDAFHYLLWQFVLNHDDMIMMTTRHFLGFKMFGMYYKSLVCIIFALTYCYYRLCFSSRRRLGWFVLAVVMSFAFIISGTRATMLLPFILLFLILYYKISQWSRAKYIFYPLIACGICALLLLVLMLVTETGEKSNAIKYAHLTSYVNLFSEHPEYLLWGQGPGTSFYSEGFHNFTNITEWTYIELVRNFGAFSLLIMAMMFYPLYVLGRNMRGNIRLITTFGAYVAYLFIAGTNPLLISSTGILVILSIYSFITRPENNCGLTWQQQKDLC